VQQIQLLPFCTRVAFSESDSRDVSVAGVLLFAISRTGVRWCASGASRYAFRLRRRNARRVVHSRHHRQPITGLRRREAGRIPGNHPSTARYDTVIKRLKVTRVYPKVSGLAAWSDNCKWYSSLPLVAVVSLFYESV
jgi:hypothetical protein